MPNLRDLSDIQYRQKLAREYSHPSSGYVPTKQEIDEAIAVGTGRKPQDVAYGEQGLQAPAVAGGLVSLDPTDYLSGAGLAKIAAMAKVGGLGLASLAGGMTSMHKMGAQSVPRMFGQAGMFAGRGAKTANLAMLAKAEEMAKAGIPDSQIWKETGWTLDTPDKLPRFEIPDNAAMYRGTYPASSAYADRAMHHPELMKGYPDAGAIRFDSNADVAGGNYANQGADEVISIGGKEGVNSGSTALHELQHAIQHREGFARGGNPDAFIGEYEKQIARLPVLERNIQVAENAAGDEARWAISRGDDVVKNAEDWAKAQGPFMEEAPLEEKVRDFILDRDNVYKSQYKELADLKYKQVKLSPHDRYKRLAGEAEARLTQARMNLTPEQRLAQYPYDPEYFKGATGVNLNDLIVRKDGGTAMSMPESNIPELMSEAEKAMLRYELSKIPKKPAVSLRDLAIGGGALGAGGLAGYYGIGAMTE